MKTQKKCRAYLVTAMLVLLLSGCNKTDLEPIETGAGRSSSRTGSGRSASTSDSRENPADGATDTSAQVDALYESEEGTAAAIAAYTAYLETYLSHPAKAELNADWGGEEDLPEDVTFSLVFIRDDSIPQLAIANGSSPWNPVHLFNYIPSIGKVREAGSYSCYGEVYYAPRTGFFLDSWWGVAIAGRVYEMGKEETRETQSWDIDVNDGSYLVDDRKADEADYRVVLEKWFDIGFVPVFGERTVYLDETRDIRAELERMAREEVSSEQDEVVGKDGTQENMCALRVLTGDEERTALETAQRKVFLDLAPGEDGAQEVVFTAEVPTEHVILYALTLEMHNPEGIRVFARQRDYRFRLVPGEVLCVNLSFFGSMPNNGISYIAEDGETHFFTVSQSGYDGSIELTKTEAFEERATLDEWSHLGYWSKISTAHATVGALSFAANGTFVCYGPLYNATDPDEVIVNGMFIRGTGTWIPKGEQDGGFLYELYCEDNDVPREILVRHDQEAEIDRLVLSEPGDPFDTYYQVFGF